MDWGFIGTLLAIIFFITTIITTVILALKFAKKKQPVWAYKTTKIIGLGADAPPGLKLTFDDKPVGEVYRTTFIFFNKGKEAIRLNDVTENVTIHFEQAEILREPTIKAMSKEAIEFSVKKVVKQDASSIELDFLYLAHEDGAVVEVLHIAHEKIQCAGNIIGVKEIVNIGDFEPFRSRLSGLVSIVLGFIGAITGGFLGFSIPLYIDKGTPLALIALVTSGVIVLVVICLLFLLASLYKFPKWSHL